VPKNSLADGHIFLSPRTNNVPKPWNSAGINIISNTNFNVKKMATKQVEQGNVRNNKTASTLGMYRFLRTARTTVLIAAAGLALSHTPLLGGQEKVDIERLKTAADKAVCYATNIQLINYWQRATYYELATEIYGSAGFTNEARATAIKRAELYAANGGPVDVENATKIYDSIGETNRSRKLIADDAAENAKFNTWAMRISTGGLLLAGIWSGALACRNLCRSTDRKA
jgi:hypothetical protein